LILTINTAITPVDYTICSGDEFFSFVLDKKSSGEDLIIHMNDFLKEKGLFLSNLKYIGVVPGPGSFTGLRSGLSFAQGIVSSVESVIIFEKNSLSLMLELNDSVKYSAVSDKKGGAYIMKRGCDNIEIIENYNKWLGSVDENIVMLDTDSENIKTPISKILYNQFMKKNVKFINKIKPFYVHNPKFKERKI
jgi:tRNA A37 threonylcarbamoyladenosine modification protein TsaB